MPGTVSNGGHYVSSSQTTTKQSGTRKSPDKNFFGGKQRRVLNNFFNMGPLSSHSHSSWVSDAYREYQGCSNSYFTNNNSDHLHFNHHGNNCYNNLTGSSDFTSSRNNRSQFAQPRESNTWLYMVVWIASVVSYINGLTGDFVHDDLSAITSNPDVIGKNPLYQTFLNDYWGKPLSHPLSHKSYRPLTIITFRLTHSVVGLSPAWYHLGNVALHSIVCLLFSRVLTKLLNAPSALIPALIFATHPIHSEAVTGIVGRADLLAAGCLLMALEAYHDGLTHSSSAVGECEGVWRGVCWAGVWSLLGTLCKEHALTALILCCAWDCCIHRRVLTQYLYSLLSSTVDTSPFHLQSGGNYGSSCGSSNTSNILSCAFNRCNNNTLFDHHHSYTSYNSSMMCCSNYSSSSSNSSSAITNSIDCQNHKCNTNSHHSHHHHHNPHHNHQVLTSPQPGCPSRLCPITLLARRIAWLMFFGVVILTFRLWMLRGSSPAFSDQDNPASFSPLLLTRTLTFLYLPALNVWLLFCPWSLSHDWQMGSVPLISSLLDSRNLVTLFFYATLLLLCYRALRLKGGEGRVLQMGIAFLVIPFLPASNIFFRVGFVLAERILYIPSMGYCMLVGAGLQKLQRFRPLLVLSLLLLFTARTIRRNSDWTDRASLFTAGLKTMPHNAKMHYNYGNLQRDLDNAELAILHYNEAIRLWPDHASAHNNLGTLLNDTGMAEHHFLEALRAHPQHAHASFNLAMIRQKQGAKQEAITLLRKSLEWDALHRDAVCALAELYVSEGREEEADALHRNLLVAAPTDPAAHNNYAAYLERAGRKEAALRHYETALSLDPDHSVALVNTARLLRALRHDQHAELLYRRALSVSWEAGVGESLGKLYLNTDRLEEAQETFSEVLDRHPHRLSTKVYLARVQLQRKQYEATEAILTSVLNEEPSFPEALLQLSLLYAYTNRTAEALSIATRAAEVCTAPLSVCAHLLAHKADLLRAGQSTEAAQKSYEAALELDATLSHAHVNLGAIFHSKGDHVQAWHHYLSAHSHDPTNSLLLENMEKLKKSHQYTLPTLTPLNCLTIS